ncbi:MAG TPA: hypothetical protein VFV67_25950 [Actinophytocola sp.]|uniref:hypothetical protein n=1 Tax=Actinophytocola sp. TaxID=1872138 RepID=UPI002DBC6335|nr:hypothetical protein [Actinophytocola sp.]HEU5474104.1 hypothetical protein [Actinophytocola sp.]
MTAHLDTIWVATGSAVVLSVALCCAIVRLLSERRLDRNRGGAAHAFRGQGEAILVAELLEEAAERGQGIRLNWPEDDFEASPIRPDGWGQYPTAELPRITD